MDNRRKTFAAQLVKMATRRSEWELKRGQYLGEISALCFLHLPPHLSPLPYLLSGTGSQILVYDLVTAELVRSFQVFEGIRVHGISCNAVGGLAQGLGAFKLEFRIAVFGERRVKLFTLNIDFVTDLRNQERVCVDLIPFQSLPKFSHWVLDVCFLQDSTSSFAEGKHCLAIGCSDNSVCFWDIRRSCFSFEVKSPDKCLLYSMRMWGEKAEALHIASGTIFNEILVWKVVPQNSAPCVTCPVKDPTNLVNSCDAVLQLQFQKYEAIPVCRLTGHEGSIFNIAWSYDGTKLVSVSDDRSARIWEVHAVREGFHIPQSVGPVLFGHSARVWDCCIYESFIITVGEDCTCRVWGLDGAELVMIKEHIGRGVWRCLFDPTSSLLITAGFDSAVKVHHLDVSKFNNSERSIEVVQESIEKNEVFTLHIPNSSGNARLVDSKSEYVRCLHFTREDTIYVATNNGFLYHAKILIYGDVQWTELLRVSEEAPIICMNLLSRDSSDHSGIEDWVAVGDGKGNMTIVGVDDDACTPNVGISSTWSAELARQLLGTFWCKSLGHRFIFTADPRGSLKLWRLHEPLQSISHYSTRSCDASLVAEFVSCFNTRIMCLDASVEEQVLVCGDLRGNLLVFPLTRELLLGMSITSESKISPSKYFKGAHGISSVCRVLIANSCSSQVEICSTGGDGCLCYLEYNREQEKLEFIGMKQVKELSVIQSVSYDPEVHDDVAIGNYAIGFTSADFIIWNLITETKVVQIPCGGWRRPNSYFLGDIPEMKSCFAFVKDEIIYIHRHWGPDSSRKTYPQNLHLQFHGREMHSLCFISETYRSGKQSQFTDSCWIATGCEDGTVRLTRYAPGVENWTDSKLLGEHVGGSAVRSICCVSKTHLCNADSTQMPNGVTAEDGESPFLLISVGAKRVLTAWKQKIRTENKEALSRRPAYGMANRLQSSSGVSSSMSFQWLSTDMPTKSCSTREKGYTKENVESLAWIEDKYENDWRYLAVTAFLVKVPNSRISVCFIVVSCSDTSVVFRALILPYRLWFEIGLLVSLASPVLALQHVIIPERLAFNDNSLFGSQYIVLGGSTDGSIAFWDLTKNVETFMGRLSSLQMGEYVDCQKRPRTGRGSQGGRWWRSLGSGILKKKKPGDTSVSGAPTGNTDDKGQTDASFGPSSEVNHSGRSVIIPSQVLHHALIESKATTEDSFLETCKIWPLHTLYNVHQSGVNCLHVSDVKHNRDSYTDFLFYVISGGDDQELHCLRFDLLLLLSVQNPLNGTPDTSTFTGSEVSKNCIYHCQRQNYSIRFAYHEKIASAHSSGIKGVWTDGSWVFSTGLDQRLRCWHIEENGKLIECAHMIISVPEPEALNARACSRNHYQIAVAGRGMQMVEFVAPAGMSDEYL